MRCAWILAAAVVGGAAPAEVFAGAPGEHAATAGEADGGQSEALPRMLVLSFSLDSGVTPETGRQLEHLLVTHLRAVGKHQVMSQADVVTLLGVEEQKQLTGCMGDSCMAQIGGALGADWMVSGTVGALGSRRILTLKLLDVNAARIENQISKELPSSDDDLVETMRQVAYEVLRLEPPVVERPWYTQWWVWTIAGAVVVGGVTAGVVAGTMPSGPPASNLGIIEF